MVQQAQTRRDLLKVINTLKKEELKETYHPYTMKQLGWFCNPNHIFHRYRNFYIPKKSGGMRKISAPYSLSYKYLLRYVGLILQSVYEPSAYAMGFVPQRSIVDNAKAHIGMNYVFNIDLKDFFPSIERARIVARLQVRPFCFTQEVALTIAGLCTMRVSNEEGAEQKYRYILPQGSPASPVITNLMCDKLDYLLSGLAKRFGLRYTRYADDITFSSMHNVYQEGGDFYKELERIIMLQGFTINEKKTRLDKVGTRQEVTGLTISKDKVNVSRKYIRDLRSLLFMWEKYGYAAAEIRLHIHNRAKWQDDALYYSRHKGTSLVCVADGKLMFLKMVKGENDSTFKKLYARYLALINKKEKQPRNASVEYIETYHVPAFEKKINAKISIVERKDGSKFAALVNKTTGQFIDYHQVPDYPIEIMKRIDWSKTTIDKLDISYCRTYQHGRTFWLLHEPFKSPYIQEKVDVDSLLNDLDYLLHSKDTTLSSPNPTIDGLDGIDIDQIL